ncbi:hypothetical protein LEM8419_02015 [Neolewinella maritima]|uniref:Flippase-like domain-containing protein n=1 Tax=Neolewinella maritima TaxID=1383882 RepID=A0ABM9B1Y8_9BACT|nr:lysylphosphatidylglycerol synthase domain-containing protein [Neolewinella maritima]CAH1001048.1 hypothetical protein LEM8419_02015 [Neolewinella maritima]
MEGSPPWRPRALLSCIDQRYIDRLLPAPAVRTWALRLLVAAALLVFAYQCISVGRRLDWPAFVLALGRPGNWRYLLLAVAMMPLNWLLEARKWQLLLHAFLPWSFGKVVRATLAGVSLSAATPNRIGEIGGRLLLARRGEYTGVVASSLLGSACQWVAFLLLAWPALVVTVGGVVQGPWQVLGGWLLPLGPLLVVVLAVGGRPLILRLLRWIEGRFHRPTAELRASLVNVKYTLMLRSSAYACLRFSVYCVQLYLLLWFFGLELPWWTGLAGIAAIYLVQAGIPLPPGLNFVTRTELGLLLWQVDAADGVAVLAAYTALFSVNVLLPALPGYWLIVRKNRS